MVLYKLDQCVGLRLKMSSFGLPSWSQSFKDLRRQEFFSKRIRGSSVSQNFAVLFLRPQET